MLLQPRTGFPVRGFFMLFYNINLFEESTMLSETATARDLSGLTTHEPQLIPLPTPAELAADIPVEPILAARINHQRQAIRDILFGPDERLLVITGPCSLHDRASAVDYGRRLAALAEELGDKALFVMRAYVEKPRTTVGWKGMLHDPGLDGSDDMVAGLHTARTLLIELAELGLPIGTELLTPMAADYLADILSWGAVGARTTESQTHRERVSALNFPVGLKNGTQGEIGTAVDGIRSATSPQQFLGIDRQGRPVAVKSHGNPDAHLILRGGRNGPNHDPQSVAGAAAALEAAGRLPRLIVDCSHANSGKVAARQEGVVGELLARRRAGESAIAGIMLESNIHAGRQNVGQALNYGVSITDECLGWEATEAALRAALSD